MSQIPIPMRPARKPWSDRWLLDVWRERGKDLSGYAGSALTAWEALEESGVRTADIIKVITDMSSAAAVDVSNVGSEQAKMLTQVLAERYDVVPVAIEGRELTVVTGNPLRQSLDRDLAFASGKTVKLGFAHPAQVREARDRVYGGGANAPKKNTRIEWIQHKNAANTASMGKGPASDALDRIVLDAMDQRTSDIHLEPKEGELHVRFRVDGVLHDVTRISAELTPLLLSRLKVSAGLDIANRRIPQDGRASVVLDGRQIDLRISTLPLGERIEKAVIRILDSSSTSLDFDSLGFDDRDSAMLRRILASNEGMVLVTGPTGSGKTTTLYSALMHLKSPETNIVTVEDPIEYRLPGINQVQVEEKQGLTFASALRSILRQDPDVVLVGEIRDVETAEIAMRASMTGHLVLSTLHTNDAASALNRLADIGLDLGNLAAALRAIIAQRLARRLCPECSTPYDATKIPYELRHLLEGKDTTGIRHAVGCPACRGTGYRGRLAIAELLVIDEETRQLMAKTSDRNQILQMARKGGMNTLWDTGLQRVLEGQTSLEELTANVTPPLPDSSLSQNDIDALLNASLPAEPPSGPIAPGLEWSPTIEQPSGPRTIPGRITQQLVIAPRRSGAVERHRILVVDEQLAHRRRLRAAFERVGCVVIEVADGESALSFASALRPDAVITEVALPKMNGVGLAQALIGEQIVDHVFVCTDQRDELLLQWIVGCGVQDVIPADEDVDAIAARVVNALPARAGLKIV